MANMSLQDIRDYVRNYLDVDVEELPNAVIDVFIRDGGERVERFSRSWKFRATEYTVNTDTSPFSLTTTTAGINANIVDLRDVRGDDFSLQPRDHRQMRETFKASSTTTGTPVYWSQWGTDLYLWPAPSSLVTLRLACYRAPTDWIALATAPDYPEEFHTLIAQWALARAYAQQDDPDMSDFFRGEFEAELAARAKRYTTYGDAQPMRLNGSATRSRYRTERALGPLSYDWE